MAVGSAGLDALIALASAGSSDSGGIAGGTFAFEACVGEDGGFSGARALVACGALAPLRAQLESRDAGVAQRSVAALATMVRAGADLAEEVLDEPTLKRMVHAAGGGAGKGAGGWLAVQTAAAGLLGDAGALNGSLADTVVDAGSVAPLAELARSEDDRAASTALGALARLSSHSDSTAMRVAACDGVVSTLARALAERPVRARGAAAARLAMELCRRTPELTATVTIDGGAQALVRHAADAHAMPSGVCALSAVGHAAAFSTEGSRLLIECGAPLALVNVLAAEPPPGPNAAGAAAWACAALARHGAEGARPLAQAGALPALLRACESQRNATARRTAQEAALEIVRNCGVLAPIEALVDVATPAVILEEALARFVVGLAEGDANSAAGSTSKTLAAAAAARMSFVTSGALMRLMEVRKKRIGQLSEAAAVHISTISACFPEGLRSYYASGRRPTSMRTDPVVA